MAKYIDADRLKAELDEHYRNYQSKYMETRTPYTQGLIDALDLAEQVIDSFLQEQPEKPVPNDLEEAAEKYTQEMLESWKFDSTGCRPPRESFIAGAKWQKEQMMKEAVDFGTANLYWEENGDRVFLISDPPVDNLLLLDIASKKFENGQKVRIIIVKEDEK